jgi:hypothetical protein
MRVFEIAAGSHKGKNIHVTKYVRTTTGMEIAVEHNVPVASGKELQWVQTVTSNNTFSKTCKLATRVDPFGFGDPAVHKVSLPAVPGTCKADDLKPFYWTDDDLKNGAGPGFSDGPSTPTAPASGRIWTQFVLALTEVTDKDVHNLIAIYWGYDRMASGEVRAAAIRRPSDDEMKRHFGALKKMYPDWTYS